MLQEEVNEEVDDYNYDKIESKSTTKVQLSAVQIYQFKESLTTSINNHKNICVIIALKYWIV